MRAPPCPYVTITGSDGARVYLKLENKHQSDGVVGHNSTHWGHLLPVSFSQLRSSVQKERRRKLIEQSEQLLLSMNSGVEVESQSMFGDSEAITVDQATTSSPQHTLWVDKYAPRHYTDLLSDDMAVL